MPSLPLRDTQAWPLVRTDDPQTGALLSLRAIAAARFAKALFFLALAGEVLGGSGERAARHLAHLGSHGPQAWQALAHHAAAAVVQHALAFGAGLLLLALLLAVEGWGLWQGRRWASKLVVATAAVWLPLEAWLLWQSPGFVRAAVFVANLAIVAWLAQGLKDTSAGLR